MTDFIYTASIDCEYGNSKNKKTITLTKEEMISLLKKSHDITYLHKTAHAFFFGGNATKILVLCPEVISKTNITEDTIESQVVSTILSKGFELLKFDRSNGIWDFEIADRLKREEKELVKSLREIATSFAKFAVRDQLHIKIIKDGKIPLQIAVPKP